MPGESQGTYHTIAEGECALSLAFEYGLALDTVWNHAENADLKRLRKDPKILEEGDVLFIPDLTLGSEDCATEERHRFRRLSVPAVFRLRLLEAGEPRKDVKYSLIIDDQLPVTGTTNSDGMIVETISPGAKRGVLTVGEGDGAEIYEVKLGGLDPVAEESGVRERLINLGYPEDPEDEEWVANAVARFQSARGLEPTGVVDDALRKELVKVHGS